MTSFNSITGRGVSTPSADVGTAGGPDVDPDAPTDPLGPGTPQSIDIIEEPPPPQRLAVAPLGGETVIVGGGGPSGPQPERPPVPVAAPAKPEKPRLAPPIVSGLGKEVDEILNKSPTMRELWAKAKEKGYHIEFRNGPNETHHGPPDKVIYINPKSLVDGHVLTPAELSSLASHEIDHAVRGPGRAPVDIGDREGYATNATRTEIWGEAGAAFTNARARDEIRNSPSPGMGPDIGIRGGFDDEYIKIYERWKSGDILTVDEAIAEMAFWAGQEPRGRNADGSYKTTEEVFLEKHREDFDERHKQ